MLSRARRCLTQSRQGGCMFLVGLKYAGIRSFVRQYPLTLSAGSSERDNERRGACRCCHRIGQFADRMTFEAGFCAVRDN